MLQCIIYNKGGVFRACLSGTPSLPVTACGAEKPQIWMYVHILHYTFLLLFMQTSSLSLGTWCPFIFDQILLLLMKKYVSNIDDTLFHILDVYICPYMKYTQHFKGKQHIFLIYILFLAKLEQNLEHHINTSAHMNIKI